MKRSRLAEVVSILEQFEQLTGCHFYQELILYLLELAQLRAEKAAAAKKAFDLKGERFL